MREILFRGLTEQGEWIEGDLVHNTINAYSNRIEIGIKQDNSYPVEVLKSSIGQFTGLCDKNGVKIFEGDKMKDRFGAICEVVYVSDFGGYRQLSKIGYSPLNQAEIISSNDTIIGNIHQTEGHISPSDK